MKELIFEIVRIFKREKEREGLSINYLFRWYVLICMICIGWWMLNWRRTYRTMFVRFE